MNRIKPAGIAVAWVFVIAAGVAAQTLAMRDVKLDGHPEGVVGLAFTPDGKSLVSVSTDFDRKKGQRWGIFQVWDVETGKQKLQFRAFDNNVYRVAMHPNKSHIAIGGSRATVWICDLADGKQIHRFPFADDMQALQFSPDGSRLAAAGDITAVIWDVDTEKPIVSHTRKVRSYGAAISPDLRILAAPNYQDVDLWEIASRKELPPLLDHHSRVERIVFDRTGKTLFVISSFSDTNVTYRGNIRIWDLSTGKEKVTFTGRVNYPQHVLPSPNGEFLAVTGSADLHLPYELELIEIASGKSLDHHRFPREQSPGTMAFNPDGTLLATGMSDKTVRLWDVKLPPKP